MIPLWHDMQKASLLRMLAIPGTSIAAIFQSFQTSFFKTVSTVNLYSTLRPTNWSDVGFQLVWLSVANLEYNACKLWEVLQCIRIYSMNLICRACPLPVFSSGNIAGDYIKTDKSYSLQVIVGYDIINITLYTMEQYPS